MQKNKYSEDIVILKSVSGKEKWIWKMHTGKGNDSQKIVLAVQQHCKKDLPTLLVGNW